MKNISTRSRRIMILSTVALVNLLLWAIPSDVVTLVARDRHVLLGRYSREHFTWIIAVALISTAVTIIATGASERARRRRLLFVSTGAGVILLPTCAADLFLRFSAPEFYIKDSLAYHRPANFCAPGPGEPPLVVRDLPEAARSYVVVPPGFPEFPATLTADRRGFRNQTDLPQYDIVVVGDSYAEGSKVSDEHPWPVRLAGIAGRTVYNLGMSGYAPQNYLASLQEIGLLLKPSLVACMLYEENDFRAAELREKPESELGKFFKQSPILQRLDAALVASLGRMNASGSIRRGEVLSWLPLCVPAGPQGRYYAFSPNLLLDLYQSREKVEASEPWQAIKVLLLRMKAACEASGARFILVYAPSKPHVVLPLAEALPKDKVHAFAALRAKDDLPVPDQFLPDLLAHLDVKETLTREFCKANGIPVVSLTNSLRQAAAAGTQVYFTYDDHFSPAGHDVAARVVAGFLETQMSGSGDPATRQADEGDAVITATGGR